MSKMIRFGMAAMVAAAVVGAAPSAFASHGKASAAPRVAGTCTASSTSKLKVSKDNGSIEADFEVDQNVSGDTWKVVMKDNGLKFFSGTRVTKPPSGSFEVRKLTPNQPGTDKIVAKATNLSTGEVCKAKASI